jgi:hypothetical protein
MYFSPIRVILEGILNSYELFELKFTKKKLILNSLMNKYAGLPVFPHFS